MYVCFFLADLSRVLAGHINVTELHGLFELLLAGLDIDTKYVVFLLIADSVVRDNLITVC